LQLADPAQATKVLSVAVALVNNVKCNAAPDCTHIHRMNCKAVQQTCGPCAANDMIGDFRDSNSQCLTLAEALALGTSNRRRLAASPSKTCVNDCGGVSNGTCAFVSVNTGASVSSCSIMDASCTAQCACVGGRYGPGCSMSQDVMLAQRSLRAVLLGGLLNSTKSSDATADTVAAWTNHSPSHSRTTS
jgi:hypothetical protein